MESIHDLSRRHFAPFRLVLWVGQDGQEDLVGEQLEVLEGAGSAQLRYDDLWVVINRVG